MCECLFVFDAGESQAEGTKNYGSTERTQAESRVKRYDFDAQPLVWLTEDEI